MYRVCIKHACAKELVCIRMYMPYRQVCEKEGERQRTAIKRHACVKHVCYACVCVYMCVCVCACLINIYSTYMTSIFCSVGIRGDEGANIRFDSSNTNRKHPITQQYAQTSPTTRVPILKFS